MDVAHRYLGVVKRGGVGRQKILLLLITNYDKSPQKGANRFEAG